ncbi:MAG: 4-diphosphocytidyl-2-C-methyl-D-erythritol kinase [Candidatus Saganbacteria bacterium]|uniref:4-diphosphocytidyl-2-C-methyl-D-erythritol kinase n=1 Tax=Candidatus Saganbacteria bacterium TaxID=2575572 RepID=A0A833P2T1_UNCSA|nr:MAG: 4-diphosphocytidyl-2-C-methyl-D-erythritol kinase [Candidatus Saganbacteria bacterium]
MIHISAFAKINLYLEVLGRREDGYHEIDSIMQSVSLADVITLSKKETGIEIISSDLRIPQDKNNTAYLAAEVFFDKTGLPGGIRIEIHKNIPISAGLAGGSADAAAVLFGLNNLYQTKLSESDLLTLAAQVGSDVSFCLKGGTCRCRGRGELVEKIKDLEKTWLVLVKPDFGISTKWVYDNLNAAFIKEKRLTEAHIPLSAIHLYNDLEKVVVQKYPIIAEIKKKLIHLGCLQAEMSGSGPTVFGIAKDEDSAKNIFQEMQKEFPQTFLTHSVNNGLLT